LPTVPAWETIDSVVHQRILPTGRRWFLVVDANRLAGILRLEDVVAVPQAAWPTTRVARAMLPVDRMVRVTRDTEIVSALRAMDERAVAHLPVMDGDRISGVLCRDQVLRHVRLRAELRMPPAPEAA
jgi:predicted transcriptional regulator